TKEVFIDGSMPNDRAPKASRGSNSDRSRRLWNQAVGGARGICGPRAVGLGTAGPPHRDNATGRTTPGAKGAIAGASESTLLPVVMQVAAHGHSHGSFAGRDGASAGSAACSLQIGRAGAFADAASVTSPSPESVACRAMM